MNIKDSHKFSLLWLSDSDSYYELDDKTIEDINISLVLEDLAKTIKDYPISLLKKIPVMTHTIQYRQDILNDFINNELLLNTLKNTLEKCVEIKNMIKFAFESEATLYNLLKRIDEVASVMSLTENIYHMLKKSNLQSKGLMEFRGFLETTIESDVYHNFKEDIYHIKEMDEGVHSLKVGINFDYNLKPIEAIVLSLEDKPFKYSRKLKKVSKIVSYGFGELKSIPRKIFAPDSLMLPDSLNNLEKIIEPAMKQLIAFCDQFNSSLLGIYEPMKQEIIFYEIAFSIYIKMKQGGLPVCKPRVISEGSTKIEGLYNINLAYDMVESQKNNEMVLNDFNIEPKGNIFILTGANRGGKTTFTQSIGQIYWLAQLGFYIPAQNVTIKIIDKLFLHFPSDEIQTMNYGRLGEECQRFSTIYSNMSADSFLLMNESFDGTSHLESLIIATDVLKALQLLGATVIYNTHLHELGEKADEMNTLENDTVPRVVNLVTGSHDDVQSFKVREGKPLGQSYAKEIAIKYGVSYEQLIEGA
ncbi:DNA mismatch repair protein MutS [Vallitalea sediminicola]